MRIILDKLGRSLVVALFLVGIVVIPLSGVMADTEFKAVSTGELKALVEGNKPFTLVDARTKEEYEEAHIVKAVSMPEKTFEAAAVGLPGDKGALLVIYCNGVRCGKSKKAARKAEALGYTNIMLYKEGFPVWEEKNLPIVTGQAVGKKIETARVKAKEIDALIKGGKQDHVIVDVRDGLEFGEGHIPTAINIPSETFAANSGVLPKEKEIIVYCNNGSRSSIAYRKLLKLSYTNIFQSTFAEWKEAGLPVAK